MSIDTHAGDMPTPWKVPECPFSIEYLPKVLDDIRLAVVDAFFSLPRGGAEIGGVLLGRQERGRVVVLDSIALECEHAFGPSFTLSKPDLARLEALLATARKNRASTPVGWYHSHTRSEIFLSDVDQEIHKRFFPEPWQVALVLKPHTFQPTRAGFFFREKDGTLHASGSYQEFVLDPLPVRPAPSPGESPLGPVETEPAFVTPEGPVVDIHGTAEPEIVSAPPAAPEPEPEPVSESPSEPEHVAPPSFLTTPPRSSSGSWKWVGLLAVALGAGLAVGAYQTRDEWLPSIGSGTHRAAQTVPSVTLTTLDHDGQLQISWDGNAPEILQSSGGDLTIKDGGESHDIALDAAHLQSGSFTYVRQGEKVDLALSVNQPGGRKLVQAATFLGKPVAPPEQRPPAASEDPGLKKERDALAAENSRLKAEVVRQEERVQRMEKALEDVRVARAKELQRKRLENQAPDTGKQ